MGSYFYPLLLSSAIIYPDVEPSFQELPSDYEKLFRQLPIINELLMQQMGNGTVKKPNPFDSLLDNPFANKLYSDPALDREFFVFKSEWDRILYAEGKVSFAASQLRDILADELAWVREHNYPLLDANKNQIDFDRLLAASRAILRTGSPADFAKLERDAWLRLDTKSKRAEGRRRLLLAMFSPVGAALSGLGQEAAAPPVPVGPQAIPAGPQKYNDKFMAAFQQLSPFMDIAFKVFFELASAIAAIGAQVANGASLMAASASAFSAALKNLEGVAMAASAFVDPSMSLTQMFSVLGGATISSTMLMWSFQSMLEITFAFIGLAASWEGMRLKLRALQKASGQIRIAFHELAEEIQDAMMELADQANMSISKFRLVMAEMIARIQRGEKIIGFLNCDSSGNMVVTFGVPDDKLPTDQPAYPAFGGNKTLLFAGAGVGLALALAGRR